MKNKKNEALQDLIGAIERLSEKVDRGNDLAEAILDEVVPLGLALDALATADIPQTMD